MISQGYPLFAVDGEGGVYAVVAWLPTTVNVGSGDIATLAPVTVDASGYLDPMPMVWGKPLRYFLSITDARVAGNGDQWAAP